MDLAEGPALTPTLRTDSEAVNGARDASGGGFCEGRVGEHAQQGLLLGFRVNFPGFMQQRVS